MANIARYTYIATTPLFMGAIITRSQFPDYWPGEVQRRQKEREEEQQKDQAKEDQEILKNLEVAPLGSFGGLRGVDRPCGDR